jgi:ATP-dependent helicase/nuclease subunit A
MSAPRAIPSAVITRQIEASDPARSAWVSANAGSGKTHVLAQRVIRLLLDGADPARILCITFTKAAAANMANKVFQELRAWTQLEDDALDSAMRRIGVRSIDARRRERARRLFALALETPGGLKVQTIHAFCAQLLHLFPFEANVPAHFEVMDEATEARMLDTLSLEVMLEGVRTPDSPIGRALAEAVLAATEHTFREMLREAIGAREALARWIDAAGGVPNAVAQLSKALGVRPKDTIAGVDAEFFDDSLVSPSEWPTIAAALASGGKNDVQQSERFRRLASLGGRERLRAYLDIFCTKDRDKTRDQVVTKKIGDNNPALCRRLEKERERVWKLLARRRAIEARDRSAALFTIAHAVIERFRAEKNRRGLLDYDDLIDKTLALLQDQRAAWVHYKLDRGIHHVLIDEAQDTSPRQWAIVRELVSDFFSGAGAHERPRTIFAVGDEKQSIFSFQGAAPRDFAAMRRHFKAMHEQVGLDFVATEFTHSFRSGANVLGAVDQVFSRAEAKKGLTADSVHTVHEWLPDSAPGLVEIWDLVQSDDRKEVDGWAAPFDMPSVTSGVVKLARRIASTVAVWQSQGLRPREVLILLRRRGALFEAIIRALKHKGIAVAGADRLMLTEHIAVMDLMTLADALLLPDDDLALATVLKSPLFDVDEETLFKLAWNRRGSLYASLRAEMPVHAEAFRRMREEARGRTPFDFYAWLLGPGDGRRRMLARLGHEAVDVLDEFLNLALDYERVETPSLQGFIAWLRTAKTEVKRDMEMERDEVRVMTVHGAKGLEAPVVVLADTTTPPQGWHPPRLLTLPPVDSAARGPEPLVWAGAKVDDVGPMAAARAAALEQTGDEYRRLLYVAMTRAIERLIICGVSSGNKPPEGCWYELVTRALEGQCTREPADDGSGEVWRFRKVPLAPRRDETRVVAAGETADFSEPVWLRAPLPAETGRKGTIRPSGAAVPRIDSAPAWALARGRIVHRLLQSLPDLPRERRHAAMQNLLARADVALSDEEKAAIADRITRILEDPRFSALFAPGSRAEVPIVGRVARDGTVEEVSGQVDRLAVTAEAVLIADYKTDQNTAARVDAHVRQLALYRAVLARLYPDRPIRAALIWTETLELTEFSAAQLDAALVPVTPA